MKSVFLLRLLFLPLYVVFLAVLNMSRTPVRSIINLAVICGALVLMQSFPWQIAYSGLYLCSMVLILVIFGIGSNERLYPLNSAWNLVFGRDRAATLLSVRTEARITQGGKFEALVWGSLILATGLLLPIVPMEYAFAVSLIITVLIWFTPVVLDLSVTPRADIHGQIYALTGMVVLVAGGALSNNHALIAGAVLMVIGQLVRFIPLK